MPSAIESFIAKWSASGAAERANKDLFLAELCDLLAVPRPNPATGDDAADTYVFERGVRFAAEDELVAHGRIDLYKEGCFLLEAKQGSSATSKKVGTAKRGTAAWNVAMRDAFGKALGDAQTFDRPPPFLIACDLGHCFDLYACFDGTTNYRAYPSALTHRIFLGDLEKHAALLRQVMLDPLVLDPSKQSAKVAREVVRQLADLARALESAGHTPDAVASFLTRCLFTMFAEDVGLLPERIFTDAIEKISMTKPSSFPSGIERLWKAMNDGAEFGFFGQLLRFNGGLFASPTALPLDAEGLRLLHEAKRCNWAAVDAALFGTLLERALDPEERHHLGADYAPHAYVERRVPPTIDERDPADWDRVRAELRRLIASATGGKVGKRASGRVTEGLSQGFRGGDSRRMPPGTGTGNQSGEERPGPGLDFHNRHDPCQGPSCSQRNREPEPMTLPPGLTDAAVDDKPEAPEDAAAVAEARADQRPRLTTSELMRRLGL